MIILQIPSQINLKEMQNTDKRLHYTRPLIITNRFDFNEITFVYSSKAIYLRSF